MTSNTPSNENEMATLCDYLSQPAFEDELQHFLNVNEDHGLANWSDIATLSEQIGGDNLLEGKSQLDDLAQHLLFYGQYFKALADALPDHPVNKTDVKRIADDLKPNPITFSKICFMNDPKAA